MTLGGAFGRASPSVVRVSVILAPSPRRAQGSVPGWRVRLGRVEQIHVYPACDP